MATHHDPAAPPVADGVTAKGPAGKLVEYEQYIDDQLRKTRSHVRSVDLAGSVMLLVAGTLGYFFLAALVDHWVMPGGLGFAGRLIFLAGYALVVAYFVFAQMLPLVLKRINPIYAAHTIERSRPGLKNGLVNFLMFRAQPGGLPPLVYQAIEEQAATNLAKVRVEAAVDRSKLVNIGYALVGIVFLCAVYALLSPKDLFKTVERVVMPWAEISAPTRSAIVEVEPGDARAFRGQQVQVAARINGLPSGDKVMLYYSTDDGQLVDRPIEMILPPDGYKHACVLPGADASLQQSLTYRIEAGDAVTRIYHVEVVAAPTIVVERVNYKYPSYTGLLAQRIEHQGDLKAIEGTEITIEALANQDMQSAGIDFDCEGKVDVRMIAKGQEAHGSFTLELKEDRQTPLHTSYQLLFKNEQGVQNPQPVRHQIEITRDVAPEIQFVSPKNDELDLPLNGAVDLELVAHDPDFALRTVKLVATSGKKPLVDKALLDEVWRGQLDKKFRFEPRKLGLKAGDVVEYTAWAEDNKDPRPNRTTTSTRRIRIVSPSAQPAKGDQLAQKGEPDGGKPAAKSERGDNDPNRDKDVDADKDGKDPTDKDGAAPGEQEPEKGKSPHGSEPADRPNANRADPDQKSAPGESAAEADKNAEGQPAGKSGEERGTRGATSKPDKGDDASKGGDSKGAEPAEPAVANDGSDDGSAIEEILKHREEQEQDKPGEHPAGDKQPPAGKNQDQDPQKAGEKNPDGKPTDERKADGKQPEGKQPDSKQPQAGKQPGDGEHSPGKKQQPGEKQQPGDKPQSNEKGKDAPPPGGREAGKEESEQNSDASKPEEKEAAGQQGGDEQGEGKEQKKSDRPSNKKPDASDRSQGKADQKGAGAGDNGQGNDSGGGEDGEKGQAGQKGQSGKSPSQGKGSGQNAGDAGDNPNGQKSDQGQGKPGDKSKSGGNSPGKPTDSSDDGQAASEEMRPEDQGSASGQKPAGDKPAGKTDAAGKGQKQDSDGKPPQKSAGKGDKQSADGKARGSESREGATDPSAKQSEGESGQGNQAKGDAKRDAKQKASPDAKDSYPKGGDPDKEKGPAGAGEQGKDNEGSPSPDKQNKPRDKSQKPSASDKDAKPGEDAQSPSTSEKESDSQGLDDGDRSGGGKKGGGQKANQKGTGGPGQNTPSDEGAGQSGEPGSGETSDRPGGDKQAKGKTGSSGSQTGDGSKNDPSGRDKPGAGKPKSQGGPGSQAPPNGGDTPQDQAGSQASGTPGDGKPGQPTRRNDQPAPAGEEKADAANLDYARKATDLAINHLKDELRKDKPDAELLDRLGWTKKDLEKFVQRWEQMRKQAQAPGVEAAEARRELDETLRSLGLRPRATSLRGKATRDDQLQGVKESRHTTPPLEYRDQSKAYSQGTARGGK